MSDFDQYLDGLFAAALAESDGVVEAHHLLLAMARSGSSPLDYPALRAALDQEFAVSLAAAGVRFSGSLPTPVISGDIKLGATARAAVERAVAAASRKRDLRPGHLLLGILLAETGTVPRALDIAGVDRLSLVAAVRAELADA